MEKSRDCRNFLRNQRGSSWGAVIQNNGHKTLNLNKFRFIMGIIYFGLSWGEGKECVRRPRVRVSDSKGKQRRGWKFSCSRGCE